VSASLRNGRAARATGARESRAKEGRIVKECRVVTQGRPALPPHAGIGIHISNSRHQSHLQPAENHEARAEYSALDNHDQHRPNLNQYHAGPMCNSKSLA
jgi:hypothetical protein